MHLTLLRSFVLPIAVLCAGTASFAQQLQFPSASPVSTLKQRVGLTDIEVVYSRPSVKDRVIFGGIVAYGQVWRTGANNATKITVSTPVKFGGKDVAAGTYSLFTIPGPTEWTVILNENPSQWGAYRYDESKDVVRVKVPAVPLDFSVESMIIDINNLRDESATLNIVWDRVVVPVAIEVDVKSALIPQIEAAMAGTGEKRPFMQAAAFYYDHNVDLNKALVWAEAAVAGNDAYYTRHLLAKILAKRGDKAAALAMAQKSRAQAVEAKDGSYVKSNDVLIASLR